MNIDSQRTCRRRKWWARACRGDLAAVCGAQRGDSWEKPVLLLTSCSSQRRRCSSMSFLNAFFSVLFTFISLIMLLQDKFAAGLNFILIRGGRLSDLGMYQRGSCLREHAEPGIKPEPATFEARPYLLLYLSCPLQ